MGQASKGELNGAGGGGGRGRGAREREETVAGGLLFTQTKNLLHKYKTIEFDLVGERPAIKYIQIG